MTLARFELRQKRAGHSVDSGATNAVPSGEECRCVGAHELCDENRWIILHLLVAAGEKSAHHWIEEEMLEVGVVSVRDEVFSQRKIRDGRSVPEENPRSEEHELQKSEEDEEGGREAVHGDVGERNRQTKTADVEVRKEFLLRVEIDDRVLVVGLLELDAEVVVHLVEIFVVVRRDGAQRHVEAGDGAGQVVDAVGVEAGHGSDFEAADVVLGAFGEEMRSDAA